LSANIVLPDNGPEWHKIRSEDFSNCNFQLISNTLLRLVRQMLHPDFRQRPTIHAILNHPVIQTIIRGRDTGTLTRGTLDTEDPKTSGRIMNVVEAFNL